MPSTCSTRAGRSASPKGSASSAACAAWPGCAPRPICSAGRSASSRCSGQSAVSARTTRSRPQSATGSTPRRSRPAAPPRRRKPMPPSKSAAKGEEPTSLELLLELGTEEIPAGFLARALADLAGAVPAALAGARLAHGAVQVWGTPRRIAVAVAELAARQPDLSERVVGPPVQAAYDKAGVPTRAALGFADKNGVDVAALETSEVPGKK